MPDPAVPSSVTPQSVFEKSSIENITKQPFTDSNHVQLLESGSQTFQKILDAISSARHIICIEIYIFKERLLSFLRKRLMKESGYMLFMITSVLF
jgi:phosphatidylserine/phosphatidylglycerophosphate/cardiolipin synthase-like enzyme